MRVKSVLFILLVLAILTSAIAQTPFKKYDIKSGIITYEMVMKVGNMEMKNKVVVYFDDYGMKECKDTYSGDKIEQSYFSDGKEIYAVKPAKKMAFKQGTAYRGTELRVEWSEFGTEEDRQSGKYKKLAAMTVAGKNCEVFEYNDGEGGVTKYAGWNKILLLMDSQMTDTHTIQRAVKVEENVNIPPEKFKVPAGFTVQ
jgi:hypothetical protein